MPDSIIGWILWSVGVFFGFLVLFTAASGAAVTGNIALTAGILIGFLLLYWTWKERQDTDSAAETAEQVGERASGLFGGVVDWFSAALISLLFVLLTVGGQFFDVIDVAIQMVSTAPVTSTALGLGGIFAWFDWTGQIVLSTNDWILVGFALVVLGVLGRRYLYGEVDT